MDEVTVFENLNIGTNILLEELLKGPFYSGLESVLRFDVSRQAYCSGYKDVLDNNKCFKCERYEMVWENRPCGHGIWCFYCKKWAMNVLGENVQQHRCVICNLPVERLEKIPGSLMVFNGKGQMKVQRAKQEKKKARKQLRRLRKTGDAGPELLNFNN